MTDTSITTQEDTSKEEISPEVTDDGSLVYVRVDITASWVVPMTVYTGEVSDPSAVAAYETESWKSGEFPPEGFGRLLKMADEGGRLTMRFSSEAVEK